MGWRGVCFALVFACASSNAAAAQREEAEAMRARAIRLTYEHEHDQAIALLRQAAALTPENSAVHRSHASAIWLKMLFLRGAVTVDHYLGSFSRPRVDLSKPPAELVTEFHAAIGKAVDLAEKRVAASPRDVQARYDLGAAVGLQASYIASIDGKLLAGFRSARRAYSEHEKVLELEPARKDARVTVGTYRYIISTLSVPMRMMAYVAGFGGGKERGIAMLEETAAAGGESGTDALFALVLLYNREKRYDDAQRSLQELRRQHPRNRLVVLEAGSTALRAGRAAQAEALLTEGLGLLSKTTGPKIPGEESLWRYKRGAARAALGRSSEATDDLLVAVRTEAPTWVQGRARVELARLAIARGDRSAGISEARQAETLCQQGNDQPCLDDARKVLRTANGR
jgi:tetratricopeptide (TPR) repeat protein